jgi:Tol biopolymer transport system component
VVQDHAVSGIWVAREGDTEHAAQISSEVGWMEGVAWAPNDRIVYLSQAGRAGNDIWIMNADGSNAKQLTVGARACRGLAVTSDGRYIIFVSDRAGHFNLWRVDIDGNNLRQLTGGDGEFYPDSTPDGSWVVYQRGEVEPSLWKVRTDGGEPVQLTSTRGSGPAVSPDGKSIAYRYLDQKLQRWGIGIVDVAGGPLLKRFDFPQSVESRFVRWTPDSRSIAYANRSNGASEIWLQALDGRQPNQLTRFGADEIVLFDWSRDGRSLVTVRLNETNDVVLIEQSASP